MTFLIPSVFAPAYDAAAAAWIVEGVKPWGKDRVRLWSFLPDVFETYARLLHPAYRAGGTRGAVRWSELAKRNGVLLGPETGFREVSAIEPIDQSAWDDASPNEGTLEREQVAVLAELLAPFTQTPDRCWVAPWVGWGSWAPGRSSTVLTFAEPGDRPRPSIEAELKEIDAWLATVPTFGIEGRDYYLFTAHLSDVPALEIAGWHQAPSIWWPDDRAWCVVTEVDGYSTYVGGSAGCIEALVASKDVEAIKVTADVGMDPGPY